MQHPFRSTFRRTSWLSSWLVLASAAAFVALAAARGPVAPAAPTWRDDPVWHDGLAEKCVYEASRTLYDVPRSYLATAYTDKELADPRTSVKTEAKDGIAVFKHHWSERAPTENYDYDYSTMTYTRADDLSPFKLTAATQEDCGASFKEAWREGQTIRWFDSVYFPDGGRREGKLEVAPNLAFADALTLVLRDFDFDRRTERKLLVIPSQRDTHRAPFEPRERVVRHVGESEIELPIGRVRAHELELGDTRGKVEARYWFASEGRPPWLHVLLRYEGVDGVAFRLKSHERVAYWKRTP